MIKTLLTLVIIASPHSTVSVTLVGNKSTLSSGLSSDYFNFLKLCTITRRQLLTAELSKKHAVTEKNSNNTTAKKIIATIREIFSTEQNSCQEEQQNSFK